MDKDVAGCSYIHKMHLDHLFRRCSQSQRDISSRRHSRTSRHMILCQNDDDGALRPPESKSSEHLRSCVRGRLDISNGGKLRLRFSSTHSVATFSSPGLAAILTVTESWATSRQCGALCSVSRYPVSKLMRLWRYGCLRSLVVRKLLLILLGRQLGRPYFDSLYFNRPYFNELCFKPHRAITFCHVDL